MQYSFVLIPPANRTTKYIDEAQRLFGECAQGYLLKRDGTSSPHITLAQFVCSSEKRAQAIWDAMRKRLDKTGFMPLIPTFAGISFRNGKGPCQGTVWVQNEIDKGGPDSPLLHVHKLAIETLSRFNILPVNAHSDRFRPHLTLARIVMPPTIKAWSDDLFHNPGAFRVAFGKSDAGWQFVETLATFPEG